MAALGVLAVGVSACKPATLPHPRPPPTQNLSDTHPQHRGHPTTLEHGRILLTILKWTDHSLSQGIRETTTSEREGSLLTTYWSESTLS